MCLTYIMQNLLTNIQFIERRKIYFLLRYDVPLQTFNTFVLKLNRNFYYIKLFTNELLSIFTLKEIIINHTVHKFTLITQLLH